MAESSEGSEKRKRESNSLSKKAKAKIIDASMCMFKVADYNDMPRSKVIENLEAASRYGIDSKPPRLPSLSAENCVFLDKEKLYAFVRNGTIKPHPKTLGYIRLIAKVLLRHHHSFMVNMEKGVDEIFIPMDIRSVFYSVKASCQHHQLVLPTIKTIRELIDTLCCLFECTRYSLGVMSDYSKSLFFGNVIVTRRDFNSSSDPVDISSLCVPQTAYNYGLEKIEPTLDKPPKFILVVEKKTILYQLLHSKFHYKFPCIVITGSGYPTCECRQFVNFIQQQLKLEVFMFVDFNPHGYDIFRAYKYGSYKLSFMSRNLVTPSMKLIGLFISDLKSRFMNGMMTFNPTDLKKCQSLSSEGWLACECDLHESFNFFELNRLKADVEHFAFHSQNSWYIAQELLADKFSNLCVSQSTSDNMEEQSEVSNAVFDISLIPESMKGFIQCHRPIRGDGHCGFRSIAFSLHGDQDRWLEVRANLLTELKGESNVYRTMLSDEGYEEQLVLLPVKFTGLSM